MENIFQANGNQRTGEAILSTDKTDFQTKSVTRKTKNVIKYKKRNQFKKKVSEL